MALTLSTHIKETPAHRRSFDALAQGVFGLSFEVWYRAGYWGDQYIPYALLDGDTVVANASVSIIDTLWQGEPRRYIQLGTVMTDPAWRGQGLSKALMERILADWLPRCDAMYLYANDSVLDFYPRFGFVRAQEYGGAISVMPAKARATKLDMGSGADIALLRAHYAMSNPFSALPMLDNWGLVMFYCGSFLRDCVYYVGAHDAVVVAAWDEGALTVYDVFCGAGPALADIVGALLAEEDGAQPVKLGFALKGAPEDILSPIMEEDSTMFVHSTGENIFAAHKTMLPLLSHA